jgi:hypothetical protein
MVQGLDLIKKINNKENNQHKLNLYLVIEKSNRKKKRQIKN